MGFWIAERHARRFGEHKGISVANSCRLEIECLGSKGQMTVLLQILGVDYHTIICHSALIEYFREKNIELAKLWAHLREINAPLRNILSPEPPKKGDVLCIIEAMKLMNEIESEYNGKISKILVNDGEAVEYGKPLFVIE